MSNFNALLSRIKYIPRWSLMRQTNTEDVAQHTTEVMFIAHTLCAISIEIYNNEINIQNVLTACLYHDISEIITGDMPTPVKYNDANLQNAYKQIEDNANKKLLQSAPLGLQKYFEDDIMQNKLTAYEKQLLKAADKLSALIKCIEELNSGNNEFKSAYSSIYKILKSLNLKEVDYFMENMLEAYNLCLDELVEI